MGKETIIMKFSRWFIQPVEYYFAKKWLDKNFGERDYWGDYIAELEFNQRQLDLQKKQIDDNLRDTLQPPLKPNQ